MSDDKTYIDAVAESLERLQIKPEDLFGYVMWLRSRYAECVEALHEIHELSSDEEAADAAFRVLVRVGAIKAEEDVSHETSQD